MVRCFYLVLLTTLLGWAPTQVLAQGIKPKAIVTDEGATFVFNTMESFFALDVPGAEVKPSPNTEGYFQTDARLLRIFNLPDKELDKTAGSRVLMPKEILQMAQKRDIDEEQFALQRPIPTIRQEYLTTAKGRLVLHWWFEMPTNSERGATQQHYMSTICNRQVLTICAPLLPKDIAADLTKYLIGIMGTIRESDDPINVKEYAKELRGTETQ